MMNKLSAPLSAVVLVALFFILVLLNNQLLSSARLDLTQNQVYSLSVGSKKILAGIDEPINLYFFFSDQSSKGMTSLRNYASRVESLLKEYEKAAAGKLKLHLVDPEPFSAAEDQANHFGLTAASLGAVGESIYMGLAGTNAVDDEQVIGFFDPQQESFLEYEISKLIYQLSTPEPVHVSLLTDLPLSGGQNPMTGRADPQWTFYTQLQQLYQVETFGSDANSIPADTDVLIIAHPKNVSESLQFSIDQYVMAGGKLLLFVDPHNESDQMAMMTGMGANSSTLEPLLSAWGIDFDPQQILLDAQAGLDIRAANGITRHFGYLGLGTAQLDRDDVTTAGLEVLNGASFGTLRLQQDSQLSWLPLLTSSAASALTDSMGYAMSRDPQALARDFSPDDETYVLAARVSGPAHSAFSTVPEGSAETELVKHSDEINMILVADTDLLSDRFWVQQANFFGQTISTPFANNGDFITNAVENLGGSNALISIRSRGTFARPFTRVQALEVQAERKFREQEKILQNQLDETERQLAQLQSQQGDANTLVLSTEQQQALDSFVQKRIEIRKALREVRYQLDKDIDNLGNWLKFINIVIAPLVLILLLMGLAKGLRRQSMQGRKAQ